MANLGIVKSVTGIVKAINGDSERTLKEGDKVLSNEQIITGLDGAVVIEFTDGTSIDLGRSSNTILSGEMLGGDGARQTDGEIRQEIAAVQQEIADIQQALENGEEYDPSQLETAAGEETGAEDESGGIHMVNVEYLQDVGHVTSGFETTGIELTDGSDSIKELILDPDDADADADADADTDADADADADADTDADTDADADLEVAEASDLVVDESNGLYTSASGNVHLLGDSTIQSVTLFAPDATWADNMLTANDGSYQITMDSTGDYTFTLLKPLYHPDGGEHASETLDFDIGAIVTNENGVEANTSFVVSVYDDGPVLTSVEGSASELFEYDLGLDGLGQIVHGIPDITLLSDGEETTLTSNGSPVVFAITDSNNDGLTEIHGFIDEGIPGWTAEDEGREVLSITPHNSAAESGTYVLNFHDVVDLPVDDNGEQETLNLNFDFAGIDGDGDQMLLGTINVQISDAVAIEVFKHPDSVDSTGTGGLGE